MSCTALYDASITIARNHRLPPPPPPLLGAGVTVVVTAAVLLVLTGSEAVVATLSGEALDYLGPPFRWWRRGAGIVTAAAFFNISA